MCVCLYYTHTHKSLSSSLFSSLYLSFSQFLLSPFVTALSVRTHLSLFFFFFFDSCFLLGIPAYVVSTQTREPSYDPVMDRSCFLFYSCFCCCKIWTIEVSARDKFFVLFPSLVLLQPFPVKIYSLMQQLSYKVTNKQPFLKAGDIINCSSLIIRSLQFISQTLSLITSFLTPLLLIDRYLDIQIYARNLLK